MAEKTGIRKHLGFIIRMLVSVGLLSGVLYFVGPRTLWDTIKGADFKLVLVFFPILPLICLIGAWRWQILLACQEIHIGLWLAFKLTLLGYFSNNFLPGLTGGDLVKAVYVTGATDHKTRAVLSVFVDRIIGMVSMGFISLVVMLLWADPEMIKKATPIVAALLAVSVLSTVFFLGGRKWGMDKLAERFPLGGISGELVKASDFYGNSKGSLLAALAISFACHFLIMILYWGYGISLGIKGLTFSDYMFVVPMISFIAALPISIMGWGTGELTCSWLLKTKGVAENLGVALSAMVRASVVVGSLPGGLVLLFFKHHEKQDALDRSDAETPSAEDDEAIS